MDCDDRDAARYPGAEEIAYDGIDQDCDGGDLRDVDQDGVVAGEAGGGDCDDGDDTVGPSFPEIPYDGIDQDCDGVDLEDVDEDGFPGGPDGPDCDDGNEDIRPGAADPLCDGVDQNCDGSDEQIEIPYDGIDQDCDGEDLTDIDSDGYPGSALGTQGADCDDRDATRHPGATEVACDGIDQDCSGADLQDNDGDGFPGCGEGLLDCDDDDAARAPGVAETACDDIDQDCDGEDLTDPDEDGYGCALDCGPLDAAIHPGATEIAYDNIDQDCDGQDLVDLDDDGHWDVRFGGSDCDDTNSAIHPVDGEAFNVDDTHEWASLLVPIPSGHFVMGRSDVGDDDVRPAHEVALSGYCIELTEVSNAQYAECVETGTCLEPYYDSSGWGVGYYSDPEFSHHPVIFVSWRSAVDYCAAIGRHLPTEAQWERAAKGGCEDRGEAAPDHCDEDDWEPWNWPWGNTLASCEDDPALANAGGCQSGPMEVGYFEAGVSPDGIFNLSGNIQEYVFDYYDEAYYQELAMSTDGPSSVPLDPTGPLSGDSRVVRGGSYGSPLDRATVYHRSRASEGALGNSTGFRCALSVALHTQ